MKKTLYFIAVSLFVILVLAPVLMMAGRSFFIDGKFSLETYAGVLTMNTAQLLLKSAGIAAVVAICATIVGGFFAFMFTKTDLRWRNIFRIIFLVPLFISPYILAVAWVDFFVLLGSGTAFMYSIGGVIFVLSIIFTPLSMIIISSSLANMSASYEEAGMMFANYPQVLRKIVVPLNKPAIFSSLILVFVLAISEFSVPAFLSVKVFTTEIFTQFSAFYNYNQAVSQSLVLIMLCLALLSAERLYLVNAPFLSVHLRGQRTSRIELKNRQTPALIIHILYGGLILGVPLFVLIFQSFRGNAAVFTEAMGLLSSAMGNSISYALIAAALLVLFGFIFAYVTERERKNRIELILLLTFGIPSTVLGIGLIRFFNTPSLNFFYSGFGIVIIGYLGRFLFIAEKLIANALKQIPVSLEEAAQISGAGFGLSLRKIIFPLIADGLFAAFVIGFIFSLGELGTTILVYPPGASLMPIKVYTIMANAPQSLTSAMSLIVLLITLAALGILFGGYRMINKKTWSRIS